MAKKKEKSIIPAINTLLEPIAQAAGEEISKSIKLFAEEKRKEKRKQNLRDHILALKVIFQDKSADFLDADDLSCTEISLLEQWSKHAQDVSSEEELLSKMWQNLLADILTGKSHVKYLIDKLKKVSSAEANILIKLASGMKEAGNETELYLLKEMQINKLVKRSFSQEAISLAIPISFIIILFFLITSLSTLEMKGSVFSYDSAVSFIMIAGGIIIFNLLFLAGMILKILRKMYHGPGIGKWSLSWIGTELVKYSIPDKNEKN